MIGTIYTLITIPTCLQSHRFPTSQHGSNFTNIHKLSVAYTTTVIVRVEPTALLSEQQDSSTSKCLEDFACEIRDSSR